MTEKHFKKIRSFVKRETRLTAAQARAIELYLPLYGIENKLAFDNIILEIGFGKGESLLDQAKKNPTLGFIGVEVHRPGVGQLLNHIHKENIQNIRISNQDVVEFLNQLESNSLSGVQIFFPDPWQKVRHHKRRLIQPDFLNKLYPLLKPGAFIHCATDWEDYAMHMLAVFNADKRFKNASETGFIPRPDRLVSSFEARGLRLGHQVWDILVRKPEGNLSRRILET